MRKILFLTIPLIFIGCSITPQFPCLSRPKPLKTNYIQEEIKSTIPVILVDQAGVKYAATKTEQHIITKFNNENSKEGFFNKLTSFIGGLGFWIILALVICFIIAPTGTLLFLWRQKEKFKNAFTETVTAIKNSKAIDSHLPLHDALLEEQSESTKKLVGEVKATL